MRWRGRGERNSYFPFFRSVKTNTQCNTQYITYDTTTVHNDSKPIAKHNIFIFYYAAMYKQCWKTFAEFSYLWLFEVLPLALQLLLLKVIALIPQVTFLQRYDDILKHKYSILFSSLGDSLSALPWTSSSCPASSTPPRLGGPSPSGAGCTSSSRP